MPFSKSHRCHFVQKVLTCLVVHALFVNGQMHAQSLPDSMHLADPTIFFSKGTYYLYGTVEGNSSMGFLVYTSKDTKNWQGPAGVKDGYALKKGDAYGTANFWAPQVFSDGGTFYMAYAANENIAIASSKSPLGPFMQQVPAALAAPVKQIDPFVFIDENGKKYLYHVRLQEGNRIFVAALKDDFSSILPETLTACIHSESGWENTASARWPVAEGPSVLRHNNLYYLFYSANDFRNPNYAVGYAVADNPYGPWTKYAGSPILSKQETGINGTGHGDFLQLRKNKFLYVFHTHNSNGKVGPRNTATIKSRFRKVAMQANGRKGMDTLSFDMKSIHYPVIKH